MANNDKTIKQGRFKKLWGMIRGRYGYEPDLSTPLETLPLSLIFIKIARFVLGVFSLGGFMLSEDSLRNLFSPFLLPLAIGFLVSIVVNLIFYLIAILPALFIRFKMYKSPAGTLSAILITTALTIIHLLELSTYAGISLQPGTSYIEYHLQIARFSSATTWTTLISIYGIYKILKTPDKETFETGLAQNSERWQHIHKDDKGRGC
jgi:hypothetical protein